MANGMLATAWILVRYQAKGTQVAAVVGVHKDERHYYVYKWLDNSRRFTVGKVKVAVKGTKPVIGCDKRFQCARAAWLADGNRC